MTASDASEHKPPPASAPRSPAISQYLLLIAVDCLLIASPDLPASPHALPPSARSPSLLLPSHTTRLAPPMAADGLRWPPNGRAPPNPSVCLQILLITVRHQFLHWPGTLYHELTQSCLPAVVRVWQSQSSQLPPPPRLALGSIAAAGVGESTVEALLCRGCSLLRRSRVAAIGR